ncbi:HlyD family efflux transporter periplasmic adaptor subunit [Paenibacillus sp. HJL G12]|uniref:HlyD family efflux transporter periplasmic adaptor subunit n=1 Tax=Paenibacillus dendrobii TaxID=2691084 RepID=A0A7X3IFC4_9BACL|nr:HlyD family efflux transporter periplasmic adaptor subunit [Paenibacillus dendrobii]MWV42568.1 HlyD family efflux transporter periplasmic adaptor subunit [Paenibacillus dendrobii]
MDTEKRSGKVWKWLIIVFVIAMILLTLFSGTIQNVMLPKVVTASPSDEKLKAEINGDGRLQATEQTDMTNQNGLPMKKIRVNEGDNVEKGDILVEFDLSELNHQLLDEEAAIQEKELNGDKLKQDFLDATLGGDEIKIQDATRNLDSYKIEFGIEQRKLQALKNDIEKKRYLKAPYAGTITEIKASKDDIPSAGQAIATLVKKADGYQFTFSIPDDQAKWLEEKETVDVQVTEGKKSAKVKGNIESIVFGNSGGNSQGSGMSMAAPDASEKKDDSASPGAATYQVTVGVTEEPKNMALAAGMKASTQIIHVNDAKGYVISNDWMKQDQDGKYVLVVEKQLGAFGNDYTVKKAYVRIIASSADQALVSGLTKKDDIITESSEPLQDGDRVRVKS